MSMGSKTTDVKYFKRFQMILIKESPLHSI